MQVASSAVEASGGGDGRKPSEFLIQLNWRKVSEDLIRYGFVGSCNEGRKEAVRLIETRNLKFQASHQPWTLAKNNNRQEPQNHGQQRRNKWRVMSHEPREI